MVRFEEDVGNSLDEGIGKSRGFGPKFLEALVWKGRWAKVLDSINLVSPMACEMEVGW